MWLIVKSGRCVRDYRIRNIERCQLSLCLNHSSYNNAKPSSIVLQQISSLSSLCRLHSLYQEISQHARRKFGCFFIYNFYELIEFIECFMYANILLESLDGN